MNLWRKAIALSIAGVILVSLPLVVESPYMIHIAIMVMINAVLGMTFSMLWSTGLITLGAASFYGIGAYTSAMLAMKLGLSFWLALPMATMITGIVALGYGSAITRQPGITFVILTNLWALAIEQVFGQVPIFGGWGGIVLIPPPDPIPIPFAPIEFVTRTPYYYLMLFLMLLTMLVFYALYNSRIGRVWKSIKTSFRLAETLGINVYRYRLLAFVLGSTVAGMVGSFYAHYYQTISPLTFGGWISVYVQLYPILGGIDFYILGPLVGAIFVTIFPEFIRIAPNVEPFITGSMIILIVLVFRGGIMGSLQKFPHLSLAAISARIEQIRAWVLRGS